GGAGVAAAAPNGPAGFTSEAFVRQARLNFLRWQEANDRGDVQTLREVATDDMASALAADVASRAGRSQRTEVEGLAATLLEVTTEGDAHWASVSFQGTARDGDDAPAPFHEIWHLRKPVDGRSGWLLAGIQQTS
ncbi:MAG: Tim44 domain-containing protein, partial [Burkholderiales bacterium]|nr:Tim44 domain-containing protein [Burkholderiales bacterium]